MVKRSALQTLLLGFTLLCASASAHTFGRITRALATQPKKCSESQDHPQTKGFLRSVLEKLAAGHEELFKGPFATNEFCIQVIDDQNYAGASVTPDREIRVGSGLLLHSEDQEKIAAVIAHELSHMLLQHAGPFSSRTVLPFVLSDDKTYVALTEKKEKLDAELQALKQEKRNLGAERARLKDSIDGGKLSRMERAKAVARIAAIETALEPLSKRIDELTPVFDETLTLRNRREKELLPPDVKMVWEEQEADEAGRELYEVAGYPPNGFARALLDLVPQAERQACLDEIAGAVKGRNAPPPRVKGELADHPNACWRVYNMQVLETDGHEAQYRHARETHPSIPSRRISNDVLQELGGNALASQAPHPPSGGSTQSPPAGKSRTH